MIAAELRQSPAQGPYEAVQCATCGDHGEIDDPTSPVAGTYENRLLLGPPMAIACPDCPLGALATDGVE